MNRDDIVVQLREALREVKPQAPHDHLNENSDIIEMLNLDSLDIGNVVVEIELRFSIPLDLEDLVQHSTLHELADFVLLSSISLEGRPLVEADGALTLGKEA